MVRVEPYLLPLARGQRTRPVPDPIRNTGPTEVVQETRPADANLIGFWEAEVGGGSLGELRHTGRVPMREGRLQVDEVGERPRYLFEAGLGDPASGLRLGLDDGDGCIGGGDLREQLATVA